MTSTPISGGPDRLSVIRRMFCHRRFIGLVIYSIVLLTVLATFISAPKHDDFWWTDGATFALNGELVRDYVAHGLNQTPMGFSSDWYLRQGNRLN